MSDSASTPPAAPPPNPPAPAAPPPRSRRRQALYAATVLVTAVATAAVFTLLQNVAERRIEGRHTFVRTVELTEDTVDPAEWGKDFARQYDSYKRTAQTDRTRHGSGDLAPQKLDQDPRLRVLYEGYAFAFDYRERRGHAYMLSDQDATERVKRFAQPGACLHCHASVLPAYRKAGREAGLPDDDAGRLKCIQKGFELVCAMPYAQARSLVSHPVSCMDCHDPKTVAVRVTRPAFLAGIRDLARSEAEVPHLPSIGEWRKGKRDTDYDPNTLASRQELRTLTCAQCHVEYYFKGPGKLLTYPWSRGLKVEQIERYYDEDAEHVDWIHPTSGARLLKAQHPEFELWSQGIHARSGVSCADCHMPYVREGAIKLSDHHVRSPLTTISRACQTCHRFPEDEIRSRVRTIQDRTRGLLDLAENAVVELIDALGAARKAGVAEEKLAAARALHRRAQWRLDFVASENSIGFHAPQETARILAEAIDFARRGQIEALRAAGK